MKNRKAQISIEYMVVVGFTTLVLASLIAIAYFYSSETKIEVATNQIDRAARKIIDNSLSVYYAGAPAKTTIDVTFPEGVSEITISQQELIFVLRMRGTDADLAYSSRVNLSGSISKSAGLKHISIEAKEGYVLISG